MQCPKCLKEQTSETQCVFCGVVFEKYRQRVNSGEMHIPPPARTAPAGRNWLLWGVVAAIVCVAAAIAFFFVTPKVKTAFSPSTPDAVAVKAENGDTPNYGSIKNKLNTSFPAKNRIEQARNATVYIETGWATSGSGFFIDANGHIVTNAHVVSVSKEDLDEAERIRETFKAAIDEEDAYLKQVRNGPEYAANTSVRDAVAERERQLEVQKSKYEKLNDMIGKAASGSPSALKVVLIDGTELPVLSIQVSDKYDLALLTTGSNDTPFITRSDTGKLAQSQRLFTVGNPQGLKFTVTSGIFSGWQTIGGIKALQTDAPINPGNSGGPLINENGEAVGVNTAKLSNSQGLGLALPIDYVFSEFAGYLRAN